MKKEKQKKEPYKISLVALIYIEVAIILLAFLIGTCVGLIVYSKFMLNTAGLFTLLG